MKVKCNDCGSETEIFEGRKVCDDCMELRMEVIRSFRNGKISEKDFKKMQSLLKGRSFKGSDFMKKILNNKS